MKRLEFGPYSRNQDEHNPIVEGFIEERRIEYLEYLHSANSVDTYRRRKHFAKSHPDFKGFWQHEVDLQRDLTEIEYGKGNS